LTCKYLEQEFHGRPFGSVMDPCPIAVVRRYLWNNLFGSLAPPTPFLSRIPDVADISLASGGTNRMPASSRLELLVLAKGDAMKSTVLKRSVVVNRHKTSVSLEDQFWQALSEIAHVRKVPLARLLEQIDQGRTGPNLSSAIRIFVLAYFQARHPDRKPIVKLAPSVILEKREDFQR